MSTTFDILGRLYPLLRVPTITTLLDGDVYRRKKPLNSVKRDIVITPLYLRDGDEMDVQPGTIFINCYAPNLQEGRPDESNLNTIADAVITRITNFSQGSTYCNLEVVSENTLNDNDQKDMSYSSIRLNVIIE